VPALVGLGAPHWKTTRRAIFCGMSLGTTRAHLARAALEAITLQVRDVFVAMEQDTGSASMCCRSTAAATGNDFLCRCRPMCWTAGAAQNGCRAQRGGAAIMAGAAISMWTMPDRKPCVWRATSSAFDGCDAARRADCRLV